MLLWIILAVITAASLAVVLRPIARTRAEDAGRAKFDAVVYRDQLEEIESDLERGLISEIDAEAARIEISRRLLSVNGAEVGTETPDKGQRKAVAAKPQLLVAVVCALICIPVLSLALYITYGSPGLPGDPHAARLKKAPAEQQIAGLISRVEDRLRENPEDGTGWDVIAPVYMKFERYQDASAAYKQAIRLLGENAKRLLGVAEAEALVNNGIINETSRKAFEKVLKIEPSYHQARYWLAIAKEQDGRFDDAAEAWQELLSKGAGEASWRAQVEYCLAAARARLKTAEVSNSKQQDAACSEGGTRPQRGPTAEQIAAAQKMTPGARTAMISQMVGRLAERLEEDGSDLEGWVKLIRAYSVLGKRDTAVKALADAQINFKENSDALRALDTLKQQLELGS